MYRTKQHVDKHVSNVLGQIRDEKERNRRGFQFAKLYAEIKEFETAKKYICGFLNVRGQYAPALKLLGQIHEGLKHLDQAAEAYKKSLQIDDKQKDVVLKICELYCQLDIDPERAQYWVDKAEKFSPHHEVILQLKEKVFAKGDNGDNKHELEDLISKELAKHPRDVGLRIKLLKLYVETERVNEAYTHAVEVERRLPHPHSLSWYRCLWDVFKAYQQDTGSRTNGQFHQQCLGILNQLVSLSLKESGTADSIQALHKFDQMLFKVESLGLAGDEWKVFLQEMQAQLFFHAGTLLLKKAQQERLSWKDVSDLTTACYLASYSFSVPNVQASWYQKASTEEKKIFDWWHKIGCYRVSQIGHLLQKWGQNSPAQWMQKIQEQICNDQGKERVFLLTFTQPDMKETRDSSYIMQNSVFTTFKPELPTAATLQECDAVSHLIKPESLHELVWLALQHYSTGDRTHANYKFSVFEDLQFGVVNMESATPETLCGLDTDAFLMATVMSAAHKISEQQVETLALPGQKRELPSAICGRLCSDQQQDWWTAAYRLYSNTSKESLGSLRRTLQRGLEVIRLIGGHSMGADIMVVLARTVTERMERYKEASQSSTEFLDELNCLQARAVHYWKVAINSLKRLSRKQLIRSPKEKLFENRDRHLEASDVQAWLQEGLLFRAKLDQEEGNLEEALEEFSQVSLPEASFHQAQIYKTEAVREMKKMTRADLSEDEHGKQMALLTKSRDSLYVTLDRLRGNTDHPLTPAVAEEIDDIESRINRLELGQGDTTCSMLHAPDVDVSREFPRRNLLSEGSFVHSTPYHHAGNMSMEVNPGSTVGSPIKSHVRPSPERLDAQIRTLAHSQASQDSIVKALIEELRESRKNNQKLQEKIVELEANQKILQQQLGEKQQAGGLAGGPPPMMTPTLPPGVIPGAPPMAQPLRPALPRHPGYYAPSPVDYLSPQGYAAYAYTGMPGMATSSALPPPLQGYYQQAPATGPTRQTHRQLGTPEDTEDNYDDYYYEEEEENGASQPNDQKDAANGDSFQIPDSQLIQEWPYGNAVNVEGKSTLTYAPPEAAKAVPPGTVGYMSSWGHPSMYSPTTAIPGMPGPGYFSSPERPGVPRYPPQVGPQLGLMMQGPNLSVAQPIQHGSQGQNLITVAPNVSLPQAPAMVQPEAQAADSTSGNVIPPTTTSPVGTNFPMTMPPTKDSPVPLTFHTVTRGVIGSPASTNVSPPKFQHGQPESEGEGYGSGDEAGDSYQEPEFEPIVQLPEQVELITGEEGCTVIVSCRAKLFRYAEKQWKERGIGQIKILHDVKAGQVRVVMRREQIHKVCANHYIKGDIVIDYKDKDGSTKDDKVLTWRATDFSDGEAKLEQFACKFKTADVANDFKENFEKAKAIAGRAEKEHSPKKGGNKPVESVNNNGTPSDSGSVPKPAYEAAVSQALFGSASQKTDSESPKVSFNFASLSKVVTAEAPQAVFGGFAFSSKPVVKAAEEPQETKPAVVVKETKEIPTANPFAKFSFGTSATIGGTIQPGASDIKLASSTFKVDKDNKSFADVMAGGTSSAFSKSADFQGLAGKPLFSSPTQSPEKGVDVVEEFEPEVDFAPLVSLPEVLDHKTGEEEEEKLFGERAKLYRHETESKQWKERGIGQIKVLANTSSNKYRILMRREQVLKVCANHVITKEMKLQPMYKSNKAWCYIAHDFSDEEPNIEQLAVKFSTSDIADHFKAVFEECQAKLQSESSSEPAGAEKPVSSTAEEKSGSLGDMFKLTSDQWECGTCYVQNQITADKCLACETPRTKDKVELKPAPVTAPVPATVSGNSLASLFQIKAGEWDCAVCYVKNKADSKKCAACETVKPGCELEQSSDISSSTKTESSVQIRSSGGFTFGSGPVGFGGSVFGQTSTTQKTAAPAVSEGFKFGSVSSTTSTGEAQKPPAFGGFKFGSKAEPATSGSTGSLGGFKFGAAPVSSSVGGVTFGAADSTQDDKQTSAVPSVVPPVVTTPQQSTTGAKHEPHKFGTSTFNFSMTTPTKDEDRSGVKSPPTPQSPEGDFYVNKEGEDDHIYFEPVVKLPEKVDIKTGEEEEAVLYSHKAKLFRFLENEWKERGLGDIKILQNSKTRKVRLLMRREKILKICLNHHLKADIKLEPMVNSNGKAWVWQAMDYADDEPKHENFAIKFKTEVIADDFKGALDAARDGKPIPTPSAPSQQELTPSKPDKEADKSLEAAANKTPEAIFGKQDSASDAPKPFSFGGTSTGAFGGTPTGASTGFQFGKFSGTSVFGGAASVTVTPTGQKFTFGQASTSPFNTEGSSKAAGSGSPTRSPGGSILAKLLTGEQLTEEDLGTSPDVEVVKVVLPSKEKVEVAQKFRLPDAFFNYENKSDCSGCIGCDPDNFDMSTIGQKPSIIRKPMKELSAEKEARKHAQETDSEGGSVFGSRSSGLDEAFDFAALASKGTKGAAFTVAPKTEPGDNPFQFAGAGASLFGAPGSAAEGGEGDGVAPSPDVHFEPIVSLPEVVDHKTGEEGEEALFRQRAKLYRYDSDAKQWKERGVGEMKILKNNDSGRYRLLLRREQVLKVACNHSLTAELSLAPLHTSETAWCWTAMDYTVADGILEQFAVKFKTEDIAKQFKDKFLECQEDLKLRLNTSASSSPSKQDLSAVEVDDQTVPSSTTNNNEEEADYTEAHQESVVSSSTDQYTSAKEEEGEEEGNEYAHEEEEEEEEDKPIFIRRATIFYGKGNDEFESRGMGDMKIVMDDDVYAFRIIMEGDDGETLCNHIICRTYTIIKNEKKKYCDWSAIDFSTDDPITRMFRVQFSSTPVANDFYDNFQDGVSLAMESEIDPVGISDLGARELTFAEAAQS